MKLFIQVLDEGYTLSVTTVEPQGEDGQMVEVKRKHAFETKQALTRKLEELELLSGEARAVINFDQEAV